MPKKNRTKVLYNKDKYETSFKIPKEIKNVLIEEQNIDSSKLKEIEEDAMGNDTILFYFPKALIISYDKLKNYNYIEDLLPNDDSYVFLLYLSSKNEGHWTLISRHHGYIEYMDAYGGNPDNPLHWTNYNKRVELGEGEPYLTKLFDATKIDIYYNPIDYQSKSEEIATCGRHACFRLKTILNYNYDLNQYYDMMRTIKKENKLSYDDIVSEMIDRH